MLINIFRIYPAWTCALWFALIGAVGLVEFLGLVRFHGAIPLTWLIRDSIPAWVRWMLLGWLAYHFGVLTNTGQPPQ